jgi:dihydrofolate reductase
MIRAIVAIDDARGIAAQGAIPWHIPVDAQYFRTQTQNGIVLMGKDTYTEFVRPLPERRNVVASRELQTVREGFELTHDVPNFLQQSTEDVWIIGGAGLYASTLQYCDELYITHVAGDFNCDRFFPEFAADFAQIQRTPMQIDNGYNFYFAVYQKNR